MDYILILSRDYELFYDELSQSNDENVITVASFMRLVDDVVMYKDSDSIYMEVILNKWDPLEKMLLTM